MFPLFRSNHGILELKVIKNTSIKGISSCADAQIGRTKSSNKNYTKLKKTALKLKIPQTGVAAIARKKREK